MAFRFVREDRTAKRSGRGYIHYKLWVDESGARYVQLVDNDEAGSFSKLLFSVETYAPSCGQRAALSDVVGLDPETGQQFPVSDNNVSGFLKAVLQHLGASS